MAEMPDVMTLFDEYCRRYRRGEQPDVREYLERAGPGQEELSCLLDRYLASAPPPEPEPEAVAAMSAWLAGEPPLLELRVGHKLRRDDVVDDDRALEREANVFAAELLMPEPAVRDVWDELGDVPACATRFDVSSTAIHWRLYNYGLIREEPDR